MDTAVKTTPDHVEFSHPDDTHFFLGCQYKNLYLPNNLNTSGSRLNRDMLCVDTRYLARDIALISGSHGLVDGIAIFGQATKNIESSYSSISIGFGSNTITMRNKLLKKKKSTSAPFEINIAIVCDVNSIEELIGDVRWGNASDKTSYVDKKVGLNRCRYLLIPKDEDKLKSILESKGHRGFIKQDFKDFVGSGVLLAGNVPYPMHRYYNWESQEIRSCKEDCNAIVN